MVGVGKRTLKSAIVWAIRCVVVATRITKSLSRQATAPAIRISGNFQPRINKAPLRSNASTPRPAGLNTGRRAEVALRWCARAWPIRHTSKLSREPGACNSYTIFVDMTFLSKNLRFVHNKGPKRDNSDGKVYKQRSLRRGRSGGLCDESCTRKTLPVLVLPSGRRSDETRECPNGTRALPPVSDYAYISGTHKNDLIGPIRRNVREVRGTKREDIFGAGPFRSQEKSIKKTFICGFKVKRP